MLLNNVSSNILFLLYCIVSIFADLGPTIMSYSSYSKCAVGKLRCTIFIMAIFRGILASRQFVSLYILTKNKYTLIKSFEKVILLYYIFD